MPKQILNLQNKYEKFGTVMINGNSNINPMSSKNFLDLAKYCEKVEKEFIKIGDAGEKNHLLVGRFMTDIKGPKIVKNQFSQKVINILSQKKLMNFYKKILKIDQKEKIYLRRIQTNEISKGCFVGYHLDTDSNPDYLAAIVIQIGKKFSGGKYRVYQSKKKYIDYVPNHKSMIISDCNYPHEVTRVTNGSRKSLVYFISKHNKKNRRIS